MTDKTERALAEREMDDKIKKDLLRALADRADREMNDEIKQGLMQVIADSIDEASFNDGDGFIEANDDIIHVVKEGIEYLFRVELITLEEDM